VLPATRAAHVLDVRAHEREQRHDCVHSALLAAHHDGQARHSCADVAACVRSHARGVNVPAHERGVTSNVPDTGASIASHPTARAATLISSASDGSDVVMSTTTPPARKPFSTPLSPIMTSRKSLG
jgi:hypothetical protein